MRKQLWRSDFPSRTPIDSAAFRCVQEWQGLAKQAESVEAPVASTVRLLQEILRSSSSQQALQPPEVGIIYDILQITFYTSDRIVSKPKTAQC